MGDFQQTFQALVRQGWLLSAARTKALEETTRARPAANAAAQPLPKESDKHKAKRLAGYMEAKRIKGRARYARKKAAVLQKKQQFGT